ncbi:sensor histidine kinase [Nonomuraea sp. NPDC050663]|uniref:sensor histidine kinase n=1 Tax=Nonomuraea sp. NPDC050663 TaxID=3364370 RepID=UPI00379E139F
MKWRGRRLDLLLGAAAIGLDLLLSGKSAVPGQTWIVVLFAVLVGAPMALLRHFPTPVGLYLAGLAIFTDQIGSFTANTAQLLLCVAIVMTGHLRGWRGLAVVLPPAFVATATNLADPGLALTPGTWIFTVGIPLLPALVGLYLRRPAARLRELDFTADALLAGGGVALAVLGTWRYWHDGFSHVWISGMFVVVAGSALGLARRLPGLIFMVEGALLVVSDDSFPAATSTLTILVEVSIAIFAMRVTSWTWTVLVYLAGSGLAAVSVVSQNTDITPTRVFTLMALSVAPIAIGRYLAARQVAADSERARVRESEQLAVARLRADQLAERERIAREVHDIVAHHVGAMVLRANAARYAMPDGPVGEALTDIRDTGHQVLQDLRGLLALLRDPGGAPELTADPAEVVRESAERVGAAGLLVELHLDPATAAAPLVTRASAARIVQEGLTNVLKHAGPGTRVRVRVAATDKGLDVEVANDRPPTARPAAEAARDRSASARLETEAARDRSAVAVPSGGPAPEAPEDRSPSSVRLAAVGAGAAPEPGSVLPSSGQGLAGMRERARALGGTLTAGPDEHGGWRLSALLPVSGP